MEAEQAINYKIVLVGNTSVGKSCIVHRFVNGKFNNDTQPTIGANFVSKFVEMDDGLRIKFDIWDTAG